MSHKLFQRRLIYRAVFQQRTRAMFGSISLMQLAQPETRLRLHLLSHRLVKPHGVALDGIFGLLSNVVWTSVGPCAVDGFEITRARLKAVHGNVNVYGVDKFPRMVDYVIPSGVRIADAARRTRSAWGGL